MPVFYVSALERYRADAFTALKQLNTQLASQNVIAASTDRISILDSEYSERMERLAAAEIPREDGVVTGGFLAACISTVWKS